MKGSLRYTQTDAFNSGNMILGLSVWVLIRVIVDVILHTPICILLILLLLRWCVLVNVKAKRQNLRSWFWLRNFEATAKINLNFFKLNMIRGQADFHSLRQVNW